jgi:hypothetical protein
VVITKFIGGVGIPQWCSNDNAVFPGQSQRQGVVPVTVFSQIIVHTAKNRYMHSLPVLVLLIGTHNTCSFVFSVPLSFIKNKEHCGVIRQMI